MLRRLIGTLALLLGVWPSPARGNGAFPTAGQVLLPADHPDTIVLGTNFGLIISEDGGAHWRWSCEHDEGLGGYLYQLAPGRGVRMMALGNKGFVTSDDLACTWETPSPPDPYVYDAFPDPGTVDRILLLAERVVDTKQVGQIVESIDGGLTQNRILYTSPPGTQITTIEVARSDPRVVYATLYQLDAQGPTKVVRSEDRGETWTVNETTGTQVPEQLWMAGVDAADPRKIYFRVLTGDRNEKLAVSEDGGASVSIPLLATGALTSFVRLDDGTLLVGAFLDPEGFLYRSRDGGRSFTRLPAALRPRALGARAGKLYAATDNNLDGFALAVSENQGDSWRRVMAFANIGSISRCGSLPFACVNDCAMLVRQNLVNPAICQTSPAPLPPPKGGCEYRRPGAHPAAAALVAALALLVAGRRRRPGRS